MRKIIVVVICAGVAIVGMLVAGWPIGLVKLAGGGMGESADGQVLVVNKAAYVIHGPERGDVVMYKSKRNAGVMEIARVQGIPGDRVGTARTQQILKAEEYFVMWDERIWGINSGFQGVIGREEILGKVWFNQ